MKNYPIVARWGAAAALLLVIVLSVPAMTARAGTTIVVTGSGDNVAADGLCTLREAIQAANTNTAVNECAAGSLPNPDTIQFDFAVPTTITLVGTPLPAITDPLILDGLTGTPLANGARCPFDPAGPNLFVEINAAASGVDVLLLDAGSGGSTVQGLVLNRAGTDGIQINSAGNTVICNMIGTDFSGTVDLGVNSDGVEVDGPNNIIDGNLISGHNQDGVRLGPGAIGSQVRNNRIGTTVTGLAALPNGQDGIQSNAPNVIISNNLIAGNGVEGIELTNANNTVGGNRIGVNVIATAALGNGTNGVRIGGGVGHIINGGNIIGGNGANGVLVDGGTVSIDGNYIGTNTGIALDLGNGANGIFFDSITAGSSASNNVIRFNQTGIRQANVVALASATVNCITTNDGNTGLVNLAAAAMTATNNWWGDPLGPTGPLADTITGLATSAPFQMVPILGCPGPPFFVTASPLPDGTNGTPYSTTIVTDDPDAGDTLTITCNAACLAALPPGLGFVDNGNRTATIGGTPTATGIYVFTLEVSDGVNPPVSRTYTLEISAPSGGGGNPTPVPPTPTPDVTVTATLAPLPSVTFAPTGAIGPGLSTPVPLGTSLPTATPSATATMPTATFVPSPTVTPALEPGEPDCGFVPYETRSSDWMRTYRMRARPRRFIPREAEEREVLACPDPPQGVVCFPRTEDLFELADGDVVNIALVDIVGDESRVYEAPGEIAGEAVCINFGVDIIGAQCSDGCALSPQRRRSIAEIVVPVGLGLCLTGLALWGLVLLLIRRRREEEEEPDTEADLSQQKEGL